MHALRRAAAVVLSIALAAPAAAEERAPAVALRGFTVGDADASAATLAFEAELSNPGTAPVSLAALSYALEVDGKRIFEGTLAGGEDVPPGRAVTFSFPGRIRYADLPGLAAKTAIGRRVPFRLVATAEVRTPAGTLALPVSYDGELSTPKRPGVGLAGLRIVSMNPFDAAVEVKVALENDNAFPLPSGTLRYRITIAGGDVSSAEAVIPAVAAGTKAVIAIPLKLSLRRVGAGVAKALKGSSAVVGLHALASLGPLAWPVDLEARLPTVR